MARLIAVEDLAGPSVVGRGGHAMHVLQFLEGLRRLGHDVLFLEFLEEPPDRAAVAYFEMVLKGRRAALLDAASGAAHAGLGSAEVATFSARADAVISLAAHYRRDPWPMLADVRPRVLIEQDPGYTHLWAADGEPLDVFGAHDVYFTVGANVGSSGNRIPTCGIEWRPLWPPVVCDWWPPGVPVARDRFTTIGSWRDYGYLELDGEVMGPKVEEFAKFMDLPRRARETLELTLAIEADDPDRDVLERHGWRLEDPRRVGSPDAYRDYIAGSLGEFSCAKGGYVGTRSGWFSDRSACYLAAGRPVILQATGFEETLPTGQGAFAVRDTAEAVEAIAAVRGDYGRHSRAARALALAYFDAEPLLARMLAEAGLPPRGPS